VKVLFWNLNFRLEKMVKINMKIYEKSFFEKKIVIKNETIYYFEYDNLKEVISVEKFNKRVIETEYVNK
jgi:hypothetical protein